MAEYLVREILNHPNDNCQPEAQGSQELETCTIIKKPKGRKQPDRSYRLPKSSPSQPDTPEDGDMVPPEAASVSPELGDELVPCQPDADDETMNERSDSLVTDQSIAKREGEIPQIAAESGSQGRVEEDCPIYDRAVSPIATESTLHQLQATYTNGGLKRNAVHRQLSVALDQATTDIQTTSRASSPNVLGPGEPTLPEIDGKGSDAQASSDPTSPQVVEPHETLLQDPAPSTPVGKLSRRPQSPISDDQTATPQTTLFTPIVKRRVLSPLTEYDWTASPPDKVETTLPEGLPSPSSTGQQQIGQCSTASIEAQQVDREQSLATQDSPAILPPSASDQTPTLAEMTAKAVHLIYEMGRRREVPKEIHSRILTTIRHSLSGTPATPTVGPPDSALISSSSTLWSASTWITMLEAGHARSKEATILNMIEWMGASEWYDAELRQAEEAPPRTKRGTLRKRLATIVLDKYLKEACSTAATDGPDNLTSDNKGRPSSLDAAGIQTRIINARRRRRLNKVFHRGRTLRKLVQMTHLGILFDPDIWYVLHTCTVAFADSGCVTRSFAKASKEEVDNIAARFRADPQMMEVLSILDEQVRLLAEEGRPDLSRFLNSLESRSIVLSTEISSLRAEYGFEKVSRYLRRLFRDLY